VIVMTHSTVDIADVFRPTSSDWWRLACLAGGTVYAAAAVAGDIAPLALGTFLHVYVGAFLVARALYEMFGTEAAERREGPGARFHLVAVGAQLVLGIAFLSFVQPAAVYLATLAMFGTYAIVALADMRYRAAAHRVHRRTPGRLADQGTMQIERFAVAGIVAILMFL